MVAPSTIGSIFESADLAPQFFSLQLEWRQHIFVELDLRLVGQAFALLNISSRLNRPEEALTIGRERCRLVDELLERVGTIPRIVAMLERRCDELLAEGCLVQVWICGSQSLDIFGDEFDLGHVRSSTLSRASTLRR